MTRLPGPGAPALVPASLSASLSAVRGLAAVLVAFACIGAGCDSPERSAEGRAAGSATEAAGPATAEAYLAVPPGASFIARAGRIHDGDSFDLRLDPPVRGTTGAERPARVGIRLAGIDAPERRQPWSSASRRHLQSLIGDQSIRIQVVDHDRYGRIVGRVERLGPRPPAATGSAPGGSQATGSQATGSPATGGRPAPGGGADPAPVETDVGLAQLEAGLAWYYRRYERDLPAVWRPRYDAAETTARRERRGLWQEPTPVPPWQFRSEERQRSRP